MRTPIVLALCLSAACGGSKAATNIAAATCTASTATATQQMTIDNFVMSPACILMRRGSDGSATLQITNNDTSTHDVASTAGQPNTVDSGDIAASGGTGSIKLTTVGTTVVHCLLHPSMAPASIVLE